MLRSLNYLYIFILFYIALSSCDLTDSDSFDPAFIEVSMPTLTTTLDQGDGVLKVEEVYVYKGGELLGVFPLPNNVPVIVNQNEDVEITVVAAVRSDGQSSTSVEYPFFDPIVVNLTLESGKTYKIPLNFKYKTSAKFDVVADFEGGHIFTKDLDDFKDVNMVSSQLDASTGLMSGLLKTDLTNLVLECTNNYFFDSQNNGGGRVFLELDYKTQDELAIGSLVVNGQEEIKEYKLVLKPSKVWNRVYLDFTAEISSPNVIGYKIVFNAAYSGGETMENFNFIDNVKLIHF